MGAVVLALCALGVLTGLSVAAGALPQARPMRTGAGRYAWGALLWNGLRCFLLASWVLSILLARIGKSILLACLVLAGLAALSGCD
ncbi:hypothetical protein PY257_03885 [Ramlibacter sp. H39-3-26]|uniref:hypothetical protein n=1 Tax=Curvibacter soli TaxID=3031331 RepID=UPI0023DB813C|nr:hypothetical protein [Ramlibacter sp. H39-3-26]MDF1484326.1 hypothetical protein [Ramlibacter sp. H39-3-26]